MVPPHETVYHCQVAPVPIVPPVSVKVMAVPGHTINEGLPDTEDGAVDIEFTVTVTV